MSEPRNFKVEPKPLGDPVIDYSVYIAKARDLFERYQDSINLAPDFLQRERNGDTIAEILRQFPDEVLANYWAHGVTKGGITQQIAAALSILENNVMVGDAAQIRGAVYASPYTNGRFVILSRKDGASMIEGWASGEMQFSYVKTAEGTAKGIKINPGAVVCNKSVDILVEPLRALFPDATILHAEEIADYIKRQEGQE